MAMLQEPEKTEVEGFLKDQPKVTQPLSCSTVGQRQLRSAAGGGTAKPCGRPAAGRQLGAGRGPVPPQRLPRTGPRTALQYIHAGEGRWSFEEGRTPS